MRAAAWIPLALLALAALHAARVGAAIRARAGLRSWVRGTIRGAGGTVAEVVERARRPLAPIAIGQALALTAVVALGLAVAGEIAVRHPLAAVLGAAVIAGSTVYFAGEVLPALLFRWPRGWNVLERIGRRVADAARPAGAIVDRLAGEVLARRPGRDPAREGRGGLDAVLAEGRRWGLLEDAEREVIGGVHEFDRTPVGAVMTPADRMATADEGSPAGVIASLVATTGYSRIPVRDRSDRVVGTVHAFDLLASPGDDPPPVRPIVRAGPSTACDDLLVSMRRRRCHLAVVEEEGVAVGLVTLEDLLEELVGEIRDEHDIGFEPSRRAFVVDGSTLIADINERRGLELPSDRAETVGGFVVGRLGRIPRVGETIVHQGWTIDVLDATPRRIRQVRFRRRTPFPND